MRIGDLDRKRIARANCVKRLFDIAVVVLTAPVTVPVGLLTLIAVRRRLGEPVLFRQTRPGMNEQPFDVLKFRTMTDARDPEGQLLPDRDRLTAFGAWLRSLSLDELPQLINVARGDMSFIGPRPLLTSYLDYYSHIERCRHLVRPGISGLAQVSGRNHLLWGDRLAADSLYVQEMSLLLDLRILGRTIAQVVRRENVSVVASDSGPRLDHERAFARSDSLVLRRFLLDDLSLRVQWANGTFARKSIQSLDDITDEPTRSWLDKAERDAKRTDLVAVDRRTRQAVAMASLVATGSEQVELYVLVDPQYQGAGIEKHVAELVLEGARQGLGANEVTCTVPRADAARLTYYEDLGFEKTHAGPESVRMSKSLVR